MRLGEAQTPRRETARKKNPTRGGLALTRRVTQFQDVKTPSREESRIYSLQTPQQCSPITQTDPR